MELWLCLADSNFLSFCRPKMETHEGSLSTLHVFGGIRKLQTELLRQAPELTVWPSAVMERILFLVVVPAAALKVPLERRAKGEQADSGPAGATATSRTSCALGWVGRAIRQDGLARDALALALADSLDRGGEGGDPCATTSSLEVSEEQLMNFGRPALDLVTWDDLCARVISSVPFCCQHCWKLHQIEVPGTLGL